MIGCQWLKQHLRSSEIMLKSWGFWAAQGFILVVAVAHNALESMDIMDGLGMLYFIPISFYWVPVILMSYAFGTRGAAVTSSWVILVSIPNWLIFHEGTGRLGEVFVVLIVVITAFLVGRLVDQRAAAQKTAKAYAAHSVLSQEELFRRLSIDIHDGAMQDLMAVCQRLGARSQDEDEPARLKSMIEGVVKQLRNLSKTLRPSILDDLGVVTAIRRQLADLADRSGIASKLEISGEEYRLPVGIELQMFRIAQEALRNVERHAKANSVAVKIQYTAKEVRLRVEDDGAGFDKASFEKGLGTEGHFGILGMCERAELVKGKIEIDSRAGSGTRISAVFPANRPVTRKA